MANSVAVLTDAKTLAAGTPNAASIAKNATAPGEGLDLVGMANDIMDTAAELHQKLSEYVLNTSSTDALNTLAANILATVS
jgi:hypothetical protein